MVIINTQKIKNAVRDAFREICTRLDDGVYDRLKKCTSDNALEKFALDILIKNADTACATDSPVCQDTGLAVVFLDIGQNVALSGEYVEDAVNEGVREAYSTLRKSSVSPLSRINTGDNTPAVIHTRIVEGGQVRISCIAKGFGSENMSRVYMLTPADGVEGVLNTIVETIKEAGSCPCPPVIVGVGIGGTMEKAAVMSKRALLRPLNAPNPVDELDLLEKAAVEKINALGIGAEGFGGKITALGVFIEAFPTHIAGLPVAVTVQCHCSRHKTVVIEA